MTNLRLAVRKSVRWMHLWLGLVGGALFCLMGVTGGLVTFRPQIATLLSPRPAAASECVQPIDWSRAARDVEASARAPINRIYFPTDSDPRVHFRMMSDGGTTYQHVIYDGCAGKVLGLSNLGWMDWIVDLHHNLLAGQIGRQWAGVIAFGMLTSALGGWLLWLLSGANLRRIFRFNRHASGTRASLDLHRAFGLTAGSLLLLASFTGLWLCFPQAMRAMLARVAPVPMHLRPRVKAADARAPLGDLIAAARKAIPDGSIREIRMPEGKGAVQIRMWRPGDFRSLGNNVVWLHPSSAQLLSIDLYTRKPAANRFIEAMAGLHYGEWGGLPFRILYGVSGFASLLLMLTGFLVWWLPKRRRSRPAPRAAAPLDDHAPAANQI